MTEPTVPAEPIVGFARHPAAMNRQQARLLAYTPHRDTGPATGPALWLPTYRLAQPGPTAPHEHGLDTVLAPEPTPPPSLPPPPPDPAPPEPGLVTEPPPWPEMVEVAEPWPHPEPDIADPEPTPAPPPPPPGPTRLPPLAEWGARFPREPLAVAPVAPPGPGRGMSPAGPRAELSWPGTSPQGAPEPVSGERLWAAEPIAGRPRFTRRSHPLRQLAVAMGVVAVVFAMMVTALRLLPAWFAGGSVPAVFNAPMMVVRAAVNGRVTAVAANAGEMVDPTSPLLTIHTDDTAHPDKFVLAGVHGVIRSVETVPGADLAAGSPLVRLHDCDRAFLTVAPDAKLTVGQAVQVKLPDLPPVAGTVRAAAGIMEPPNSLVVGLPPGAMPGACPVGATAAITSAAKG